MPLKTGERVCTEVYQIDGAHYSPDHASQGLGRFVPDSVSHTKRVFLLIS